MGWLVLVLAGGYKEEKLSFLDDPFPSDEDSSIDDYDYLSDSDLDEEEEDCQGQDVEEAGTEDDLRVEKNSKVRPRTNLHAQLCSTLVQLPIESAQKSMKENTQIVATGRRGRVITLPDVAYQTCVVFFSTALFRYSYATYTSSLKALVFYLYTDEIAFAPLRSQGVDRLSCPTAAHGAPLCSPKSMYRVADKVRIVRRALTMYVLTQSSSTALTN